MTEHLDVLVVGAGLSGIGAAHYLQTECPWASFAIFEARGAIGGTWDLFRYPGIRSDSDMFTLGYSFRPWTGEKTIADGGSILQYIKDTATEAHLDEKIRFHHRIISADWSTADSLWRVVAERPDPSGDGPVEEIELTCGFIFSCSGYYRYDRGYLPDFAGMDDFAGQIIHPQQWPDDLDHEGKRIVVIGSGATAITLIPNLAKKAALVTMLQRSPSYIASVPAKNPAVTVLRTVLRGRRGGQAIRWLMALSTQATYVISKRWPTVVKRVLRSDIARRLPKDFDVDTHFTPSYDPWDQRLCVVPEGDLFTAISEGRADVVTDHIDTFTETGIRLHSGRELEADIIITATGLELLFLGGIELAVDGEKVDIPSRMTYKGMMLEGVPNLAIGLGYTNASWTLKCDLTCGYVCRLLNHMRDARLPQCTPVNANASASEEAVFGLTSGYVQRSLDILPKQGTEFPWEVHQSYLRDYRALKMRGIHDDVMVFSAPEPPTSKIPEAAGVGES